MSLLLNSVPTVTVYTPEMNLNEPRIFTILKGGSETTWKHVMSTSYSNSSYTISAPPPSPAIAIDRHVYQMMTVTGTISGKAPVGQRLLQTGYWALRSYPLARNTSTVQLSLNNTATSVNLSDVIGPLLLYNNGAIAKEYEYSMCPTELDESCDYQDLANSVRNPLASYLDSSTGLTHRGAFAPDVIVNPLGGGTGPADPVVTATVTYTIVEPFFCLSPLVWGRGYHKAMTGIQTFDLTINWNNDLSRMFSFANGSGSVISNVAVNLGPPSLLFKYITPQLLDAIPKSCEMNYNVIDRYPTFYGSIAPNSTVTISSANIQLNSVPIDIYIAAREQNSDLTAFSTDSFLPITQLSVNFNNRSGLLSNADIHDLYNVSKRNGLCQSFQEFSGKRQYVCNGNNETLVPTVGGCVKIQMAKDIGLDSVTAPGLQSTYQLQLNATVYNQRTTPVNVMLYVIVISQGVWTVENNRSVSQIGVISKLDILNSEKSPVVKYKDMDQMMGGNVFEDIGNAITKGLSWVKDNVVPLARDIIPVVSGVKSLTGLGEGEEDGIYDVMGGARYPRSAMRHRLRR